MLVISFWEIIERNGLSFYFSIETDNWKKRLFERFSLEKFFKLISRKIWIFTDIDLSGLILHKEEITIWGVTEIAMQDECVVPPTLFSMLMFWAFIHLFTILSPML